MKLRVFAASLALCPQPFMAYAGQSAANQKLFEFYGDSKNFQLVWHKVEEWWKPENRADPNDVRILGCVAFMSTALRFVAVHVPLDLDNEEPTSLVTKPFSEFLEYKLHWQRISDINSLLPGDVMFTKDNAQWPTYPDHTYMFHSWKDQTHYLALVVDNQGAAHDRELNGHFDPQQKVQIPFAYALREANN